jgi:alkanesulfonate monooxygenase SsuD/methylene tetrahydromethanopterin reductase-like flavin-dependent oxidoreductase (luciferase family)
LDPCRGAPESVSSSSRRHDDGASWSVAIGSFDVVVDRITRADADGFPIVWTHQASGLDPFVAMAVAARQASRIEVGTALIPAILRHPQGR